MITRDSLTSCMFTNAARCTDEAALPLQGEDLAGYDRAVLAAPAEPNRKLAHTIKPTRGPAAQLETLADAAQLIADLEQIPVLS
jgi:hypothetical protein